LTNEVFGRASILSFSIAILIQIISPCTVFPFMAIVYALLFLKLSNISEYEIFL